MTDLFHRPATDVAALLRTGALSARDLTAQLLDRIDVVNPTVNAVVETDRDAALHAAAEADDALARGGPLGPLHGVPITVKEAFPVTGLRHTWGDPAFAGHRATRDALVVNRLRAAGATIIGTTNVAHLLADTTRTTNPVYGPTTNPHDPTRTPGGSSGGSAAALASGLTFLEYASDLAGSIRIPAAFCGVYGLRPTPGTVPLTGFQPPNQTAGPDEMSFLSVVGPLARSAADLRVALNVTGGPAGPEAGVYSWRLAPSRLGRLNGFRVGVVLDHPAAPVTGEVGSALSDAVDAFAKAGATIVTGWPEEVDPVAQGESFGFQVGQFFAFNGGDPGFASVAEVVEQHRRRMAARAAWDRYFEDVDVFLCPAACTVAMPTVDGERSHHEMGFWIAQVALAGLPVVSAPVGRAVGGLPVGAQIVGPRHGDDTAITFADHAADVVGGFVAPGVAG
jgi:amidase